MAHLRSTLISGSIFATVATMAWALAFIAPHVTGVYSIYDLTIVRFLIAGALGAVGVLMYRAQGRLLQPSQKRRAALLGAAGYLGYGSCITAGVIFGGPVLTPAFIGVVPVLLAVLGNARDKTVRWRALGLPLTLMVFGLACSTASSLGLSQQQGEGAWAGGLFFSLAAVGLWIAFSVLNQDAMKTISSAALGLWTALMMLGAGLGALCLIPLVQMLGLFKLPSVGFALADAGNLYAWSLAIAVTSSIIGAWAWNAATHRLPMVLSGQLVALESLFAAVLGLVFHGRLPTLLEALGLLAVLAGAVTAVAAIASNSRKMHRASTP